MKKNENVNKKYIVGVGASAGGLEAISEMFSNIHDNTNFCYVIVQHLSSDHKSLMGELLSKHTSMQIFEATDDMKLEPNYIYLIPNKYMMTVKEGRLKLHDKLKDHSPNNAVDIFFDSLAEDAGNAAIGVILSGTGTDGTKGIESIKSKGGIVVVQDPMSAKFDGMPNSAIASGYADLILTPDMIAEELFEYVLQPSLLRVDAEQHQKDEYVIVAILEYLRTHTGYDFREYKRPTIYRRLARRMSEVGHKSLTQYLDFLRSEPEEAKKLYQEFLIGVTKFFRDSEAFEQLQQSVLPLLLKGREPRMVKVWVVACSTGEEAYSMAILLKEFLDEHSLGNIVIKIFATDIDKQSLDVASRGIYSEAISEDVKPEFLSKYFVFEDGNYKVASFIRKMVVFAHHNISSDPPFSKIDFISCRNMLIYMSVTLQKLVLKSFLFALNPDGYLFLGPSENLGILRDSFMEVNRKWKIYRGLPKPAQLPYTPLNSTDSSGYGKFSPLPKPRNAINAIADIFNETLLEEQRFAGILIDKNLDVKQATGNFKDYLNFPEGNFNFNLLKMVHNDLVTPLNISIRKAVKNNERVMMPGNKVYNEKQATVIDIIVKPYILQKDYLQPFIFIILQRQHTIPIEKKGYLRSSTYTDNSRIQELENEVLETRENLQSLIEQIESANEELQTSNESIISSNEELQSTNEELQSLNEELHTVNAEHQLKIKELIELNDDLNNYFRDADIGQIIIDKKLLIRKFTPATTKNINLIESDIGRSIIDISHNFMELDFINNIKTVLKSGQHLQREVVIGNGSIYLMKLNPYLRLDETIDGVVITFIDITEIRKLDSILTAVFNSSTSGIIAMNAVRDQDDNIIDLEFLMANKAAYEILNQSEKLEQSSMLERLPEINQVLFTRCREVIHTGVVSQFEILYEQSQWYKVVCVKMMDGVVATLTNITESKESADLIAKGYQDLQSTSNRLRLTNEQLQISNMDLYQFASIASHDLKEPLRKIMAFGNILEDRIKDKINEQEKNFLQKIINASGRMHNLIDDVLTFSRLSNTELPLSETDLNSIVNGVIDDLEISINSRGAEIKVGKLPVIKAVPAQMHQLFHNLIANALKFNNSKVPVIEIEEIPAHITLLPKSHLSSDQYYAIKVKDNGIGFQKEFEEKIFKMFQRLNTTAYSGTGIGLAICKKIIENHGGVIHADSELNKGSTFTVVVPKIHSMKQIN